MEAEKSGMAHRVHCTLVPATVCSAMFFAPPRRKLPIGVGSQANTIQSALFKSIVRNSLKEYQIYFVSARLLRRSSLIAAALPFRSLPIYGKRL